MVYKAYLNTKSTIKLYISYKKTCKYMSFDIIPILVFITIMRPAPALQNLCQRLWVVYKKGKHILYHQKPLIDSLLEVFFYYRFTEKKWFV